MIFIYALGEISRFSCKFAKKMNKSKDDTSEKSISEHQQMTKKKLDVVSQKNALQLLLQKHVGYIETEKKFEWLKTPDPNMLPREYTQIVKALSAYRDQKDFLNSKKSLSCDIVLECHKLIIEYDENQHFSKARQITLENYPKNIKLSYSITDWINECKKKNAKDNYPADRDEKRAYYDAVRDIEAYKKDYKLIRIKHGDTDWEDTKDAEIELKKLLSDL